MRLSIRISLETNEYIEELQRIFEDELEGEMKFTKSQVCSRSYFETKNISDWKKVQNTRIKLKSKSDQKHSDGETRATLNLSDEFLKAIDERLRIFPEVFGVQWVTKGFIIKLVVKACLINRIHQSKNYIVVE